MSKRYRYIMVGGFLGAGKTTAIQSLAQHLTDTGQRVGLICNDQSTGLVDTALLRSKGFSVEEITGGCFCCRFDSLLEAAQNLTSESAPDLFLAEPVGSCTDLVATVSYPLRRIYGDRFSVAPLSVVVDPGRAARIFGLTQGGHFSEKVTYVYRKQLEEADLIVINKCDASPPEILDRVVLAINEAFPHAKTFVCSAKYGTNLEPWFKSLLSEEIPVSRPLEINYDTYAEGEALLGWLNCTVRLKTDQPFDGNRSLLALVDDIRNRVVNQGGRIAHLKATLDSHDGSGTLSVVSLVENNDEPDLRESLLDYVNGGSLVVNLRAEAEPVMLETVTRDAITALSGIDATIEHLEQFKPGRPIPTHRMAL